MYSTLLHVLYFAVWISFSVPLPSQNALGLRTRNATEWSLSWAALYKYRNKIRYDILCFLDIFIYIYNLAIYVALYCWRLSDSSWESGSLFCCRLRFLHLWDFPRAAAAAAAADAAIDYYLNEAPLDTTFDRCRVHHYRGAIEVVRLDWNCSPMFQIVEALE